MPCCRMADEIDTTPGGCRIWKGRCFERLEWEEDTATVFAYFHDGSIYRYFGLPKDEALAWIARLDPGCYFNGQIWPGKYVRIKPPD